MQIEAKLSTLDSIRLDSLTQNSLDPITVAVVVVVVVPFAPSVTLGLSSRHWNFNFISKDKRLYGLRNAYKMLRDISLCLSRPLPVSPSLSLVATEVEKCTRLTLAPLYSRELHIPFNGFDAEGLAQLSLSLPLSLSPSLSHPVAIKLCTVV